MRYGGKVLSEVSGSAFIFCRSHFLPKTFNLIDRALEGRFCATLRKQCTKGSRGTIEGTRSLMAFQNFYMSFDLSESGLLLE